VFVGASRGVEGGAVSLNGPGAASRAVGVLAGSARPPNPSASPDPLPSEFASSLAQPASASSAHAAIVTNLAFKSSPSTAHSSRALCSDLSIFDSSFFASARCSSRVGLMKCSRTRPPKFRRYCASTVFRSSLHNNQRSLALPGCAILRCCSASASLGMSISNRSCGADSARKCSPRLSCNSPGSQYCRK
jgi:hypothetical protein